MAASHRPFWKSLYMTSYWQTVCLNRPRSLNLLKQKNYLHIRAPYLLDNRMHPSAFENRSTEMKYTIYLLLNEAVNTSPNAHAQKRELAPQQ